MVEPVSVILPAFNTARFVAQAVDSILEQSCGGFELIIIDDCSTDDTPYVLDRFTDIRIRRYRNAQNEGISCSLNRGIDMAKGEYIAIMHSDDIALPHRLETQVKFMEANPDIDFLGTNMRYMDAIGISSEKLLYNDGTAPSGAYLKWLLLWGNPLAHPTMMMRSSALQQHNLRYDTEYDSAEDYELWARAARVCDLAVISDVCLLYRKHESSITSTHQNRQNALVLDIATREQGWLTRHPIPPGVINVLKPVPGVVRQVPYADFVATSRSVLEALKAFLAAHTVSIEDEQHIRSHAVETLRRIARKANQKSRFAALGVMWAIRSVAPKAFSSRKTGRTMLKLFVLGRM